MAGPPVPCPHASELPGHRIVCDDCQRERKNATSRAYYQANRERVLERTAAYYRAHREQRLEQIRAYHAAHYAELRAAERERYYRDHAATLERKRAERQRTMADPVRAAARREYHRMWQRLDAQRNGHPMPPVPEERYPDASSQWTLPAEPIREAVTWWMRETGETDRALARRAGVSPRLFHRLRAEAQEGVGVASADRLATAIGLHLDLLYEASA